MKEIGGYFELECYGNSPYHSEMIRLNTARNALRYIIRAYQISKLFVPYYTCPVIWQAIRAENCEIVFYDINENWEFDLSNQTKNAFVLYNNYFGVCGKKVKALAAKYENLIIDNAQAFYAPHCGLASFYSPRKFFGLPDGGLLNCAKKLEITEADESYFLCSHLLKRHDVPASDAYHDFIQNDDYLSQKPIRLMSKITQALMSNINYQKTKKIRLENFNFLHQSLSYINQYIPNMDNSDVPLAYPLLVNNAQSLRKKLISHKIYVAQYWPGIEAEANIDSYSLYLQQNLLPIPLDQRYSINDMHRICEVICS